MLGSVLVCDELKERSAQRSLILVFVINLSVAANLSVAVEESVAVNLSVAVNFFLVSLLVNFIFLCRLQ